MGAGTLGRKKKNMADRNRKAVAITIKGDKSWREWIEAVARHARVPVSVAVEHAMIDFARKYKYPAPSPERLPSTPPELPPGDEAQ